MEKETLLILTSMLLILFLFLTKNITRKRSITSSNLSKLPPGPRKLPLIGNLHQLVGSLPWRALADLAKVYGPIIHVHIGEISTLVVSSPRLAKEVLKTHDLSLADKHDSFPIQTLFYNGNDIAFAPYGEYWREMRKICTLELMSNKKVTSYGSIRAQVVSDLIASVQASSSLGRPFNLTEGVFLTSNAITCKAAFGHSFHAGELMPMLKHQTDFLVKRIVPDLFPSLWPLHFLSVTKGKLLRMQRRIDGVLDNIIEDHKQRRLAEIADGSRGEQNLLDFLVDLQQNGGGQISHTSIKAIILEMFVAATDTTATVMEWALTEMLKNRRIMEKAQAEVRLVVGQNKTIHQSHCEKLDYLKMVIKETLRLHPPGPLLLPRHCREVCEIDGYTIPAKTQVLINAWAIGRDPSVWNDAEIFKPERFDKNPINFTGSNYEFIPFGAGRRMCPGLSFGLAVDEIVLANLLYHFDWALPEGMDPKHLDMDEVCDLVARRKNPLYAVATSPNPASFLFS